MTDGMKDQPGDTGYLDSGLEIESSFVFHSVVDGQAVPLKPHFKIWKSFA
jgi:hypothetical protein